ncbi:MAG: cysteine desulfurase NifS [Firmicutes bacterium]|nr:cysteine desulfurase NifS [[Eubacterium] siraeum]MCM1488297.1 cysteine desulfurase NifS [Bacillota bacterium]
MLKTKIYLDNAATTRVSDRALEAMLPFLKEQYGNPSSIYTLGREASIAVTNARSKCAEFLNARPAEIYFTSGGSESDNWAIRSVAETMKEKGKNHIVSSVFEHHAVLHTLEDLEKKGFEVTYLPVYQNGIVKAEDVKNAITDKTALVTIMYANNEIGTIQPIAEIGAFCKEKGVLFHTDAVQAAPHLHIDVQKENIDLLSISGHKLHAPKGVGLLYCRRGVKLRSLISGGGQERGLRAGTENTAGIVALAEALTAASENMDSVNELHKKFSKQIYDEVMKIDRVHFNGDYENRIPSTLNFSFEGVEGESLLLQLDLKGIAASSGSACTSGSLDPSHVLLALGLTHEVAHGSLRISMSDYTTQEEIDTLLSVLPDIIQKLRAMSPLWERIIKEAK